MAGQTLEPKLIIYDAAGNPLNMQDESVKEDPKPEPIPAKDWIKLQTVQDNMADIAARGIAYSTLQSLQAAYHQSILGMKVEVRRFKREGLGIGDGEHQKNMAS